AIVTGYLQDDVSRRSVHPVEQHEVGAGLDILEALAPPRVDFDHADGLGFPGVLRAVLARFPGRMDAADVIKAGVGLGRQIDGLRALPNPEIVPGHCSFSVWLRIAYKPSRRDPLRGALLTAL